MSEAVEKRFDELEQLALQHAKAQALVDHLTEFRKSKKALLMKEAEKSGKTTAAIQEREAYAHPEYVQLLEALCEATEKAVALKWRLELSRMRFEWARSKEATRRAEMNLR